MTNVLDLTLGSYLYVILVASYTLVLFGYWAVKSHGRASAWYYYVMGLLISHILVDTTAGWARYLFLTDNTDYYWFLKSTCWAMRGWVGAITITAIAIHATRKLFRNKGNR